MTDKSAEDVLSFWFGPTEPTPSELAARWFRKDVQFDAEIRSRFNDCYERARMGALQNWTTTANGRLALIILLDQFPRNMFRGSARMFESDSLALREAEAGVAKRDDERLSVDGKSFLYMPFMHAEDLTSQDRCVGLFRTMARHLQGDARTRVENSLDFAIRHRDIIKRFGRFPHRNALLGRTSTTEELQFLEEPGSSF